MLHSPMVLGVALIQCFTSSLVAQSVTCFRVASFFCRSFASLNSSLEEKGWRNFLGDTALKRWWSGSDEDGCSFEVSGASSAPRSAPGSRG